MRNVIRFALMAAATAIVSTVGFAQAAKTDLSGTWGFSVETGAGPGTPTITLKQDADKLTGHYSGQLGEADLTGSVKDQDFTFVFTVVAQGMPLKCTYAATSRARMRSKAR
jgi:hypothetical protein